MRSFAELLWARIPAALRRFSLTLSMAFTDGGYLRAWAPVAVLMPIAGAALGLFLGAVYNAITDGALYSFSLLVIVLMAVLAALGAGIGFATWTGFVVADLVFTDRSGLPGFHPSVSETFWSRVTHGYIPLGLAYALLFGLLVLAPLIARSFAAQAESYVGGSRRDLAAAAGGAVYVIVLAGLAYGWAQAVPVMIRPLWTFSGGTPEPEALQPLQDNTVLLAILVGVAALARIVVAAIAAGNPNGRMATPSPPRELTTARRIAAVPLQALLITVLLSGLIANALLGAVFFLMILGILAIRTVVMPMVPGYARLLRRIPLLLRIVVCAVASWGLSAVIAEPAVRRGGQSFTPLVVVLVLSLVVAVLLLPGPPIWDSRPPSSAFPGAPGRHRDRWEGEVASGDSSVMYRVTAAVGAAGLVLLIGSPAYANVCNGPIDCALGDNLAFAPAGITFVLVAIVLLPEILTAGAAAEAASTEE